jgi:SAM-dependent methyltransferase
MAAPGSPHAIRDYNTRYHDAAAATYDEKWGIGFGKTGQKQVVGKLRKGLAVLGSAEDRPRFGSALEIGAGTGYFSLNLLLAGICARATCTDISPGMLATLEDNAAELDVRARLWTRACDAESLPFEAGAFDLVIGHAVLHHIPDLDRALAEVRRVLAPGGVAVFAGEPSERGDRLAGYPKWGASRLAPAWRRVLRARPALPPAPHEGLPGCRNGHGLDGHALEPFVDVHTFTPNDLAGFARRAGFAEVGVRGEELLANWFGWTNRTLEATADPASLPWLWFQYAYRGYLALQAVDATLLEPRLPAGIFYNLILAARK